MTDQEMRIAMAESCGLPKTTECPDCYGTGFTGSEMDHDPCMRCNRTGKVESYFENLPDYPNDWNAIKQVVNGLSPDSRLMFLQELDHVTAPRGGWFPERIVTSTLREWCEAFLRAVGKWEETDADNIQWRKTREADRKSAAHVSARRRKGYT